jgi:alpha-beta hydrolase superfamily lysophospholipase
MRHSENRRQSKDGLALYFQQWEPETPSRATICLVHGLGEHSGRYEQMAAFFTSSGFAVFSFDLRGHGKSEGPRGHTPSFEAFMQDIDLLFEEAGRQRPGQPCFLYGHSLGGILVLNYALRRKPQVKGVIATSSGLRTVLETQKNKIAFAKAAASVLPALSMPSGLDAAMISRDPEVVKLYQQDPLVHDRASLAMAKYTLEAIDWAFANASEFPAPLLLVHGAADQIAYARGSQEFSNAVCCDCTLKLWEGLYHETHNEPEKAQVLNHTLEWMESKL